MLNIGLNNPISMVELCVISCMVNAEPINPLDGLGFGMQLGGLDSMQASRHTWSLSLQTPISVKKYWTLSSRIVHWSFDLCSSTWVHG